MRILRVMSEHDDRTAGTFWAVNMSADSVEVVGERVEGEGKAAVEDGVEDGGVGVGSEAMPLDPQQRAPLTRHMDIFCPKHVKNM